MVFDEALLDLLQSESPTGSILAISITNPSETAFAAQILDRHVGLSLLDEPDDLLFAESASLHIRHSPG